MARHRRLATAGAGGLARGCRTNNRPVVPGRDGPGSRVRAGVPSVPRPSIARAGAGVPSRVAGARSIVRARSGQGPKARRRARRSSRASRGPRRAAGPRSRRRAPRLARRRSPGPSRPRVLAVAARALRGAVGVVAAAEARVRFPRGVEPDRLAACVTGLFRGWGRESKGSFCRSGATMEGPEDSLPRPAFMGWKIDPVVACSLYCRAIEPPDP